MKVLSICTVLLLLTASAMAQETRPASQDHRIREPYITATGATVDKPGMPQSSGPTPLDRRVQQQDNRIDGSLCNGC